MTLLIVAAMIWIGCHLGIAGSRLRAGLVRSVGETGFRIAFSIASLLAISFLVVAYKRAPQSVIWTIPDWLRWALVAVMLLAFLLLTAALLIRSPTAVGGDAVLRREPTGILRITRHPMLWSFALWAFVHILGNGDWASLAFFGAFLVSALAGMPSIDAKVAARDPQGWEGFSRATSIVPFLAIAERRNRLALAEIGWLPLALGALVWAVLLWSHPWLFGVYAAPIG